MSKTSLQARWDAVLASVALLDAYKQYFFNHEMRYVKKTILELLDIQWDWSGINGYENVCEGQIAIAEGLIIYLDAVIMSDILSFTV